MKQLSNEGSTGESNGRLKLWRSRLCALGTLVVGVVVLSEHQQAQATIEPPPQTLVITRGGTYSGNWTSTNPDVPAVTIQTREPVIIKDSVIRGRGDLIRGYWVNLKVINTRGYALKPQANGRFPGRFLAVEDVLRLEVLNNFLEGTSGIYVNIFQGDRAADTTIRIVGNQIKNIDGRYVNAAGNWTGKRYLVQAIQLSKLQKVPNVEIAWNEIINEPSKSAVEENINIYESSGTAKSPISIHDNYIQGAYSEAPDKDVAYSGGGIMVGDGRQDDLDVVGGFVNVFHNQVISTSNQGIAIAGGHDQHVYQNRIVSSGRLPDRVTIKASNVGAYVWDYQNGAKRTPPTFFSNTLSNNLIGWLKATSQTATAYNNLWLPSCTKVNTSVCTGNLSWPSLVTLETEQQERQVWLQKLRSQKVVVGPVIQ